ncbi:hypothetical protein F5890DRAFT_228993 [Lentinula detonsa]|uniref:Uncharacterized protein n=1 Tax=Lentinula detonsa TaxID=2804962 RepID=A0AA38PXV8_9AGAR|nr:hypothetical protein F5890DRAFT_228993 [Lentinula detonsa]
MPSWFPGCEFKKVAAQCFEKDKIIDTAPFEMVMDRSKTGSGTSIIASGYKMKETIQQST